jgi:hypothetical protein
MKGKKQTAFELFFNVKQEQEYPQKHWINDKSATLWSSS